MPIPTAPTILLAVGAFTLIFGRWMQVSRWFEVIWLAGMLGSAAWLSFGEGHYGLAAGGPPIHVAWSTDAMAVAGQWLAIGLGALFGVASFGIRSPNDRTAERLGFLSFLMAGMMLAGSANDLVTMALTVELVQFACWALRKVDGLEQVHQPREPDDEAYRWLGLASSACLWLGIALLANLTASTEYDQVRSVLTDAYVSGSGRMVIGSGSRLGLLSIGLIVAGLGSRLGLVPWQLGLLESCRNVGYWTAGCVVVGSQLAGVLALARLCGTVWVGYRDELLVLLLVLAGLTFAVAGALSGLGLVPGEGRLRRWAGSISMLHGGWLTIGLMAAASELASPQHSLAMAGNQPSALALLFFATGAALTGITGLFVTLSYLSRNERDVEFIDEVQGLVRQQPLPAGALIVVLASLIGQPPLWGFWSNWLLLVSGFNVRAASGRETAVPHAGLILVGIVGAVATLVTAGAVIRCARVVLLEQPISRTTPQGRRSALIVGCICALILVVIGLFPAKPLSVVSEIRPPRIDAGTEDPSGSSRGNPTARVN